MSQSPYVIDVSDDNFEQEVLKRSIDTPVVVDFWAPWCAPCQALGPILEQLAAASQGAWILAKLNTDDSPKTKAQFQIRGIPAVKAFKDGAVAQEFVGVKPQPFIEQWLQELIPQGFDLLVKQAKGALGARDFAKAQSLLELAEAQRPKEAQVMLMMAHVAAGLKQPERAQELFNEIPQDVGLHLGEPYSRMWFALESSHFDSTSVLEQRVEQDPSDLESTYALAVSLSAELEYDRALALLLELVKRDRSFREDAGRLTMIRIFNLIGAGDPRTLKWQQRLGQVMYV